MSKLPISRSLFACTLLGLSATLVATNPKEAAYAEHLSTQFYRQLEQNICREAGFLHASCLSLLNASKSDLISFIQNGTKRTSFSIFSLYETELFIVPFAPSYQIKAIGIFGQFYTYSEQKLSLEKKEP
jgi:Domain of unknown function (DUF4359)